MTTYNLALGGGRTPTLNEMFPQGTPDTVASVDELRTASQSFANHQRSLTYDVTRDLDLRAPTPYGGGGVNVGSKYWYDQNRSALVATDILRLITIPPYTLLRSISYGVMEPVAGLILDIGEEAGGFAEFANVAASVAGVNHANIASGSQYSATTRYVGVRLDTLGAAKLDDLVFWINAEVKSLYNGTAGA